MQPAPSDERDPPTVGVLFVDIADSTRLYHTLGDARARELVLDCLGRLSGVVTAHGGTIIDRIGDELMCTFDSATAAVAAAVGLQQAMAGQGPDAVGETDVSVRIGLAVGPVVRDGIRVFGKTVYTAKRIATLAKPRQIVTTPDTVARLGTSHGFQVRYVDRVVLKGDRAPSEIVEVVWDPVAATDQRLDPRDSSSHAIVFLRHAGRELVVDENRPEIKIGRGEACDLVVTGPDVSWLHARIECRKGRPWLTDVSTNGTYVHSDGATASALVHRDTVPLAGGGYLGLGRSPVPGEVSTIAFACRIEL